MLTTSIVILTILVSLLIIAGTLFCVSSNYEKEEEEIFDEGEDRAYSVRSVPSSRLGLDNRAKKPYRKENNTSTTKGQQ